MKPLTRFEIAATILSFGMILACGLLRQLALRMGFEQKLVDLATRCSVLLLFFVFAFSAIGLAFHFFVYSQTRVAPGVPPIRNFLSENETMLTFSLWGFLGIGALIALPFALQDLVGFQFKLPIGRSRGVLVADIGMTFDQVKQRSTLKIKEPYRMRDGTYRDTDEVVFDYRIGDSTITFPQCRYHWLVCRKSDPERLAEINIGISPQKMAKPALEAFQRHWQELLSAEGWTPGHYIAKNEEVVRWWGGKKTTGDGRFWLRGNTVLIFETNRMDEWKSDEPPGSGEFILYLDLRPKGDDKDLVFEPSAWQK